jgi:GNAT superfamily N-acetyltransferase
MIVELKPEELEKISSLAAKFRTDSKFKFVPEQFFNTVRQFISAGMGVVLGLYEEDSLIGAIGGILYPDLFDGELMATEIFWYVDPARRGKGLRLLKGFEQWAKDHDAKRVVMVHLSYLAPEKLEKFYTRQGYTPLETHYIKEVA